MKSVFNMTCSLVAITFLFLFASCEKDTINPSDSLSDTPIEVRGGGNGDGNGGNGGGNGKGKGKNNDDDGGNNQDTIHYASTYQITAYDEFDPLYRFSFSDAGDLVLLQTDSTVTHWGTDYWGSWADPYPYLDGIVHYFNGLTEVTYDFESLSGDMFDVNKTLSVTEYLSGNVTTTYKHIGIFTRTAE